MLILAMLATPLTAFGDGRQAERTHHAYHVSHTKRATGDAWIVLGERDEHLTQFERAVTCYRRAFEIARANQDRPREAASLRSLGNASLFLSQTSQALSALQQSQKIAQSIHDRRGEAQTLVYLADAYNSQSQYERAAAVCEVGLRLARSAHDRLTEGNLLSRLGVSFFLRGRYAQSIDYHQKSLHIAQTLRDSQLTGDALGYLGDSYSSFSEFGRALTYYKQSLPIERRLHNNDGVEAMLGNLGRVDLLLGQYSEAKEYYCQSLALAITLKDSQGEATWLNDLGRVSRYEEHYPEAVAYYQRAVAIARSKHYDDVLGKVLGNLGETYWLLKQYEKASDDLQQALRVADKIQDLETQQWALINQGNVYLDLLRYDKADDSFQQGLRISRETGTQRAIGYCLYRLMESEQAQAHTGVAILYGKQAVNVWQKIRRGLTSLDLGVQKRFVASKEDTYRSLAELLIDEGRLPEAQQVLGLLKTQEYSDFVRGDAPGTTGTNGQAELTPLEEAAAKQYVRIADQITAIGERKQALLDKKRSALSGGAAFSDDDQAQLDAANATLSIANLHLRNFLAQLSAQFEAPTPENRPLQERLAAMKNALGLQNTLRQLHTQGQDVVVLETVLAPDRYAVIVTTSQSQKVAQYPITTADLGKKLLAFRQALQDPEIDPRLPAQELYKILVAPIEEDLAQSHAQTLMWSLDGPLRYIPIAALYDGRHYLAERYANEVFTLGSQSGFGREDTTAWEGLGLGVSQPMANSGFDPLPAVPDELHGVIQDAAHQQGVVPGEVLLNEQFTRPAMEHALEGQTYTLVHIASHFAIKPGNSDLSYLLLGDGSHLSMTQMASAAQIFQGVDLLTLSACNTAIGRTGTDGKEVDSLATIAQQQGAATVVASLWPVSDTSTEVLMRQFYHWREAHPGDSKAEALRQAQMALLQGTLVPPATSYIRGPRTRSGAAPAEIAPDLPPFTPNPTAPFAHPFYWATFVLFGNWR